jgi:hypothetical protein
MDGATESLNGGDDLGAGRRPRDLALLLLAMGTDPPRDRARDQQADRAGAELQRRVLDRLAALDPEPDGLAEALSVIVADLGPPSGPTRAIGALILQEWEHLQMAPGAWAWLVSQALEHGKRGPGKGRRRGAS